MSSLDVVYILKVDKALPNVHEGKFMSHALKKADRLYIPPRDKTVVAKPRAAISETCSHTGQVKNAFDFGFSRYEKAMEDLSKV